MSSTKSSTDKGRPPGRTSSFRKSDFVIRNKQDDSFSQIDSFKITAKKQTAESPARNPHLTQQQQYAGVPSMMNPLMHGFTSNPSMPQPFPHAQFPQQATSFMHPQIYGLPQQPGAPAGYGYQNQSNAAVQMSQIAPGVPHPATTSGYAPPTTLDDGFSEFAQFSSIPGETMAERSDGSLQANASIGDILGQHFGQKVGTVNVQSFPLSATEVQSVNSSSASVINEPAADDFQGFASFHAASTGNETEFTDFNGFAESPSIMPTSSRVDHKQEAASDEDFGAFASLPAPDATTIQHSNEKPLPKSLDGKRMNIVVKKNLAASSGGVIKETAASQNSSEVKTDSNTTTKPRSSSGLANLAETLANAKSQLNAPVIPPPEEQKDFSILQEVVNSLDRTNLPPVVQQQAAFRLPDSPTKVDEIFPRCTPKKSSMEDSNLSSFEPFADFSSPVATQRSGILTENEQSQEEFGGFADFSITTLSDQTASDSFGEFSAPASVAIPFSTVVENKHEQATPQVKSHAVDWSAFSALDELRAEEEEENLGDFSVFGSTLKVLTESQEATGQPNLLSPNEQFPNQLLDNMSIPKNSSGRPVDSVPNEQLDPDRSLADQLNDQGVWFSSTNQAAEDWAEFKEHQSPPAQAKEDDWAAFSEAPPTQAPPPEPTNHTDIVSQPSKEQTTGHTHSSNAMFNSGSGLPRVSSTSLFTNKFVNDISNDNDSDWSDAVAVGANQPDNISSDWSFKDDVSMHDDVTSTSSAGRNLDSPKVAVDWGESLKSTADWPESVKLGADWSEPVKPAADLLNPLKPAANWSEPVESAADWSEPVEPTADWSEPVEPTVDWSEPVKPSADCPEFKKLSIDAQDVAIAGTPDEDDWAAFGTIDRSKRDENLDNDSRSRSSTLKTQPVDEVSSAGFHFSTSPPPFSPETPTTVKNFNFTMENPPSVTTGADQDDWSAFGDSPSGNSESIRETPSMSNVDDDRGAAPPPVDDSEGAAPPPVDDSEGAAPPPVDDDGDEWGDFGVTATGRSVSPITFSPPPLTDGDFSPHGSLANEQPAWFTFTSRAESDGENINSPSAADELSLPDLHSPVRLVKGGAGIQHSSNESQSSSPTDDKPQMEQSEETLAAFNQLEDMPAAINQSNGTCIADGTSNHSSAFDQLELTAVSSDQTWKADKDSFMFHQSPPLESEVEEPASASEEGFPVFSSDHCSLPNDHFTASGEIDASSERETKPTGDELRESSGEQTPVNSSTTKKDSLPASIDEDEAAGEATPADDFKADFDEFEEFAEVGESTMTAADVAESDSGTSNDIADWAFQPKEDDDEWTFKSPPATLSPPPSSPPPPADDFGDFPDEEFQQFGGAPSAPSQSASSPSVTQLSGDQFSSLLREIFNAGVTPSPSVTYENKMTDLVRGSMMWRSLVDLNQSVSLQLEWRWSESKHHLESSLHIAANPSAHGLMDGVIQPLSLNSIHSTQQQCSVPSLSQTLNPVTGEKVSIDGFP